MSDTTTAAPDAPAATIPPVQSAPASVAAQPVPTQPAVIPSAVAPVAPVVAAPPPVAVTPAVVQPAADVEPEEGKEPGWLRKRLEREQKAVLRKLGVESDADAKAAIEAHKARIEAEKTELQRANEKAAKVDPLERQNVELLAAVTAYADAEMRSLTATQRAAVESVAGDNPAKRIEVLNVLRPTWVAAAEAAQAQALAVADAARAAAAAQAAAAPPQPATPAPLPPPASTAPASTAPAISAPQTKTPLEVYRDLKTANPMRAAQFRRLNEAAIAAAEKTAPPS